MPAVAALTPAKPTGLKSTGLMTPVVPIPDEPTAIEYRIGVADSAALPDPRPPIQYVRAGSPCDPSRPAGFRRNGMLAGMGDGSVRVIRYDVSPRVFWKLFELQPETW